MGTSRSEPSAAPFPLEGRRVLVANRGEIACRILRAVRDEGGIGIAVHSDADRSALHVRLADVALRIGPAPVAESYRNAEAILEACRRSRAELLHPGYGFFAENAAFAAAVEGAGVVWIGPSPEAIRVMGDKVAARRAVAGSGVPLVPGTQELPPDAERIAPLAEELGYPVLIKAAFGGGGKGMRSCGNREELLRSLDLARREADRAFGDATVYLEKQIVRPRHIEIQILADAKGRAIHLGERECSIQRRHQKLLEESPTPSGFAGLRERMGNAAVEIARAIGYTNAGTVEFLVDPQGRFYFLEMNTRLQVEHPVTEMVTRTDIVRQQLRIALGQPLALEQERIEWSGHAIECRINAEDPGRGFLPSIGQMASVQLPQGPGVRNDVGFATGATVTPHYDPMLGKLIVWGQDRPTAIARARRALHEYRIAGVKTNLAFHSWLLAHPRFARGETDTSFLEEEWPPERLGTEQEEIAAIAAAVLREGRAKGSPAEATGAPAASRWRYLSRPGTGGDR